MPQDRSTFNLTIWKCHDAWLGHVQEGGPAISSQQSSPQEVLRDLADQLDAAGGIKKVQMKPMDLIRSNNREDLEHALKELDRTDS